MEISSNYIKDIIQKNRDNIAFVIGNGIHYQYQDCDISWRELLESLWSEYIGKQINIPKGISYTEFYDIIELNSYYNSNTNLHNSLKNKELRVKISDYKGIESNDLYKLIFEQNRRPFDIKTVSKHDSELYRNKFD